MEAGHRLSLYLFFFFQAEDGIRDLTVTGVQTCALPISELNRAGSGLDGHAARGTRRRGGGRRWLDVTQDHRGDARHDRDGLRRRGELRPARLLTACGERRNQTDGDDWREPRDAGTHGAPLAWCIPAPKV